MIRKMSTLPLYIFYIQFSHFTDDTWTCNKSEREGGVTDTPLSPAPACCIMHAGARGCRRALTKEDYVTDGKTPKRETTVKKTIYSPTSRISVEWLSTCHPIPTLIRQRCRASRATSLIRRRGRQRISFSDAYHSVA